MKLTRSVKMSAARFYAVRQVPYFASAIMGMVYREVPLGTFSKCGTMGVNNTGVLFIEPECIDRWSVHELGGVLVHEAMHLIRDHEGRCDKAGLLKKPYNIAADAEINDDLRQMKLSLPGTPVFPEDRIFGSKTKAGLLAEAYYELLMEQLEDEVDEDGMLACAQMGSWLQPLDEKPEIDPIPGSGWAISSAGTDISTIPVPDQHSEGELANIRTQVANSVLEHASRAAGSMPLSLQRWAQQQLVVRPVPWDVKLQRVARRAAAVREGMVSLTFNKISRRQAGVGFGPGSPVMPAWYAPIPEVFFVGDTSGSMGVDDCGQVIDKATEVLRGLRARITFAAVDTQAHVIKKVGDPKILPSLMIGGGGTSFLSVFEDMQRQKPKPDVAIIATDGFAQVPPHPPRGIHVIWLLIGRQVYQPATYGEYIRVPPPDMVASKTG